MEEKDFRILHSIPQLEKGLHYLKDCACNPILAVIPKAKVIIIGHNSFINKKLVEPTVLKAKGKNYSLN